MDIQWSDLAMKRAKLARRLRDRADERGMSLLELMFAGFVLTVGMLGSLIMVVIAIQSNSRNKFDSTGTMVAQLVMEHINTIPTNQQIAGTNTLVTAIPVADCTTPIHASQTWQISVVGGSPVGNGAAITGSNIDWTQAYAAVPNGYKMQYWSCGDVVWEVRWNVQQLTNLTKLIVVSARQSGTANAVTRSGFIFAPPVTLRTISGP
jgi:Tfp pilus assembly protein PilV